MLESKLLSMKGKTVMHNTVLQKVINYKIIDGKVHLVTDKNWFELDAKKAEATLIRDFLSAADEPVTNNGNGKMVLYEEVKKSNLTQTLLNNIDLLKDGKIDIKSAQAMNQTVNTLLNIVKAEIQIKNLEKK